ncbi:hypothetical protein VEA_001422 [Vibrio antiquarius]|uniref:Uncharacterized protein n=1 Tax=Vibrio antiquarius (strain Ex25) TaxID=150340 RepID=A0ACA6QVD3_VIBAE|nr:hypothetical protein VEA_001422 [Vibrio antiquarius]CDT83565.1 conserved hypothetical protein [Vibrio diabolicus]
MLAVFVFRPLSQWYLDLERLVFSVVATRLKTVITLAMLPFPL